MAQSSVVVLKLINFLADMCAEKPYDTITIGKNVFTVRLSQKGEVIVKTSSANCHLTLHRGLDGKKPVAHIRFNRQNWIIDYRLSESDAILKRKAYDETAHVYTTFLMSALLMCFANKRDDVHVIAKTVTHQSTTSRRLNIVRPASHVSI